MEATGIVNDHLVSFRLCYGSPLMQSLSAIGISSLNG